MKNKFLIRRLLGLLVLLILFTLCAVTFGVTNALKFTILFMVPILIILVGGYFLSKKFNEKGTYPNFLAISIIALIFFSFSFLGSLFDPRNKTPFGWNTFLISAAVGITVFFLGLLALAVQKLLEK